MTPSIPSGARLILTQLHTAGFEAHLVGGCVRDLIRGVEPQDWDICTSALPREIQSCFPGFPVLETGLKHGTVTLRVDHRSYEVTTYRSDGPYSDGRRPDQVRFVPDLAQDLARRDFTMNAMAMDLSGALTDPFDGAGDIRQARIRCVGDPCRRFREDGLRLMRALRFASCLGYAIEPRTGQAIVQNLDMLDRVAAERINGELCKLLMGRCVPVLRAYPQVFCRFWPQLAPLVELEQNNPWHCWGGWEHTLHALEAAPADLTVRLAVLLHDAGKPPCKFVGEDGLDHFYGHPAAGAALADQMLRALKFDNDTRRRVVRLVEVHDAPIHPTQRSIRRWLGNLGQEAFFQLLEVKRCDNMGQAPEKVRDRLEALAALKTMAQEVIAQGQCFSLKDLAVDGRDAIAAGIPPGPQIGAALSSLLDRVISGELPNDRPILLEQLRPSP